jgi:uncharacterized membrane protein
MPHRWHDAAPEESGAVFRLEIWPHRSLPLQGFAWAIGLAVAGLTLPLVSVLGTTALWGLLPFAALAISGLWLAIRQSYHTSREVMRLSARRLELVRSDPGRPERRWITNPYWVRTAISQHGPVPDYLILSDGRREIELGAFLSPEERLVLKAELDRRLQALRH